jgi:hypothetical protein
MNRLVCVSLLVAAAIAPTARAQQFGVPGLAPGAGAQQPGMPGRASFCSTAITAAARLICADPDLAARDAKIQRANGFAEGATDLDARTRSEVWVDWKGPCSDRRTTQGSAVHARGNRCTTGSKFQPMRQTRTTLGRTVQFLPREHFGPSARPGSLPLIYLGFLPQIGEPRLLEFYRGWRKSVNKLCNNQRLRAETNRIAPGGSRKPAQEPNLAGSIGALMENNTG